MNYKKGLKTIIGGLLILLMVAGCAQPKSESATAKLPKFENDKVVLADGTVKQLTFYETVDYTGTRLNHYLDENKNNYGFDQAGNLVHYTNSYYGAMLEPPDAITAEAAEEIALHHVAAIYGDVLEGYVMDPMLDTDTYYSFSFSTRHGKDGFITGWDQLFVSVAYDGTVDNSVFVHLGCLEGFDESLLDDVTKEDLEAFAAQKAKEEFSEMYSNSNVKEVYLKQMDGKYTLKVHTSVETIFNGMTSSRLKIYLYPLE